jgi:hypothetical protein
METVETINLVDEYNKLKTENEQLQATIILILDACEDVNSPDRKVRIEIRNRCREALKEKVG